MIWICTIGGHALILIALSLAGQRYLHEQRWAGRSIPETPARSRRSRLPDPLTQTSF